MSYASGLAKLTPVAGIWSTAIPAIIYGIFGTCRYVLSSIRKLEMERNQAPSDADFLLQAIVCRTGSGAITIDRTTHPGGSD